MAINFRINGTLKPIGNEPTHSEKYNKGGYRSVDDDTQRNALDIDYKEDGMLVYVRATKKFWILISGDWKETNISWTE